MDGWMDGWMAATVTIINQPILAPIPSFLSIGDLREKKKKKIKERKEKTWICTIMMVAGQQLVEMKVGIPFPVLC